MPRCCAGTGDGRCSGRVVPWRSQWLLCLGHCASAEPRTEKYGRNSLIPSLNELSRESEQSSQLLESALYNLVLLL